MLPRSSAVLRLALAINLAFSLICGVASALYAPAVAHAIGAFPAWTMTALGIGLVLFATGIGWTLARLRIGRALLISALDLVWVLVTVPMTVVPGLLTPLGAVIVLTIAGIVGVLGVLQLAGIRLMLSVPTRHAGEHRHCVRVRSAVDPDKLWAVIRDLGSISRYSAGLSASRLEGGGDIVPGAVRVCTNHRQQSWAEEVVAIDNAARFVVFRFRSEAEDFPFPLAALTGGWTVTPGERGSSRVEVWWTVRPRQRWLGWLVVALMTIPLDRDLPRIIAAMEAETTGLKRPRKAGGLAFGYC